MYLLDTLNSIINNTSEEEKAEITVIVLLSELNDTFINETSTLLSTEYNDHLKSGFLIIIRTCMCIYPSFEHIKQTFKDSEDRLLWRAKQNIDFAFLMLYSREVSDYYVHIEDDVIAASDFVRDMKHFIANNSQPWILLECSKLGFIGKIFRSKDVYDMAMYLLEKYDEMPCDLLLGKYRGIRGQKTPIHSQQSLFQHIGRFSSLKNKLMPSIDKTFKDFNTSFNILDIPEGDNPPADIETNIEQFSNFKPVYAYDNNASTYFWGVAPKVADYFLLKFYSPHNISRIIILTGDDVERKDVFINTQLDYGIVNGTLSETKPERCDVFRTLVDLVDGDLDTDAMGVTIPENIMCLKIKVKKKLKTWTVIREIRIYL